MKKVLFTGVIAAALAGAPAFAQSTPSTQSPGRTGSGSGTGTGAGSGTGTGSQTSRPSGQSGTAQSGTKSDTNKSGGSVAAADQHFVSDTAIDGMAEVELGHLAQQKAESSEVKQFAQRMIDDHGKANDELKSLASSKNITLPTSIDAKHKATHDRLEKLSGAAFDRAYMQAMVADHQNAVKMFRTQSTSAKDSDIKAFAAKTLPTLEDHLKEAQSANRAVATSGSSKTSTKGTTGSKDNPGSGGSTGANNPGSRPGSSNPGTSNPGSTNPGSSNPGSANPGSTNR